MKPGPFLFVVSLLWLLLGAAVFFYDPLSLVWLYTGLVVLVLSIGDFLFLFFLQGRPKITREIPVSLAQGRPFKARLLIRRDGGFFPHCGIFLFDLYPPSMDCSAFPALLDRKLFEDGRDSVCFEYTLVPRERGVWAFQGAELLLGSVLRFWRLKVFCPCKSRGRTYPDFSRIKAAAGADLRFLPEQNGIKQVRRRGQGMEFKILRDFQEGDTMRAVDWRASSRKRSMDGRTKLIVREYQEEQDQQVLFLLDTGYRLHRSEGRVLQFDKALEALLLLSWVSLKHGDSVSVGTFGRTRRWLYPRKGISAFPHLMNGLFDLTSSAAPSSPFSCLEEALSRLKRRTFIILISNFREEDGESLSWILKRVEKRHLLLLVNLREKESEAIAERSPQNANEALETAAAFSYLASRRELYRSWEHIGLLTLESQAEDLSPALINRYLEVKKSGRL
jgi:uncharacterized protein (DUF58 family)